MDKELVKMLMFKSQEFWNSWKQHWVGLKNLTENVCECDIEKWIKKICVDNTVNAVGF